MALDKGLVQNINLRANGDQLLAPMRAFGREINKATAELNKLLNGFSKGAHLQDNQLRKQVQLLQRLVGEASTLQNLLTGSNRPRNNLLMGLDEQRLGKQMMSASKLKRALDQTKTSGDALEVRLAQLYKRFNALGDAGRKVGQHDLTKALNTEQAIREVRRLEQQISKLDATQNRTRGGYTGEAFRVREELKQAQGLLLQRIQNPSRVNWTTEISMVSTLTERLRQLTREQHNQAIAANRATEARRRSLMAEANLSPSQLQASINRSSGQFAFTRDQARMFDMRLVNAQVEQGTQRLQAYQAAMARAVSAGRSQEAIDRLGNAFGRLKLRVAEATAQQKAFNALPESRMKALNEMLFGGGGMQFAGRIAGASLITTAVFGAIGAFQGGARAVVEFEDALAKLQAIAGATDVEMETLKGSILEVAKNSRFSTVEITQSATAIAQAGFSAKETATVLQDALLLATGSGSSPAEAVDTLTSALGAFQLQATESTRIVDVLVNGLNRSKLSITQMQAAIQYAGATAFENGMGFEELVAVAGSLANAGIRSGSTIGTGLRQLLVDLKTPTEDFKKELSALGLTLADVDVKALGMAQVVKNLTEAGFSAEAAYESFEVRAASSFLAFRNQIDLYDELALSITQMGAAQEAADRASDSTAAKWQRLLNSLNALIESISGSFLSTLGVVIDVLAAVAQSITAINNLTDGWAAKIALVAGAFALGGWLAAAAAGIVALVGTLSSASNEAERLTAATNTARQELDSKRQTVASVEQAIEQLISREKTLSTDQNALMVETINLTGRFGELANQLQGTAQSYDGLLGAMMRYRGEALRQAALTAESARIAAVNEKEGLRGDLTQNLGVFRGMSPDGFNGRHGALLREAIGLGSRNGGVGLEFQNDIRAMLNRLNEAKNQGGFTPGMDPIIATLQERLDLMVRIAALNSEISLSDKQIGLYNERTSAAGQARDRSVVDIQRGITSGMQSNKDGLGSGDVLINRTLATANKTLASLRGQLGNTPAGSARAMDLQRVITLIEAEVAKVTRERTRSAEDAKDLKDEPGARLTIGQIKSEVERRTGQKVTQTLRSAGEQAGHDRRAGIKRNPHQAPHVRGTALDMPIVRGMDPMEVVAILEDMGLEVTQAPVKGVQGIRYINPNHGTGPHWHFEWKVAATQFERRQSQAAEQAARELQQLLEAEAGYKVGTAKSRIDTIQNQAKAGSAPISTLATDFESALEGWRAAKLAEFDTKNPIEGLSETLLKQREMARQALEEQLTQEAAEEHAKLWRSIGDYSAKVLEEAMASARKVFEETSFAAEQEFEGVVSRGRTLGNNLNRTRFGVGAEYRQQRDEFNAGITRDRKIERGLAWQELSASLAVGRFAQDANNLAGTEGHKDALIKLREAEAELLEIQRERADVQRSLNERTQEFADIPLGDRLRDSLAAWADNSGAMDSWGKTLENNIGPALDLFANQLAELWTSVANGTASVKQALVGFIGAFAKFVQQIIAKALALMAIKAILSAFGLQLTSTDGGTVITKKSFNGGYVSANDNGTRKAYGGGYVNRGVSNRDSANYDLAYGEYVVRNKSVRELGLPFMEAINKEGAKGLKKMGAAGTAFAAVQAPKQETNVYVVADRKQAGMGPNDVLVTIHEDILTGGPTKKLIKQVAQGG